jgi:hypothetical protein
LDWKASELAWKAFEMVRKASKIASWKASEMA